jgi:hypothetical protein
MAVVAAVAVFAGSPLQPSLGASVVKSPTSSSGRKLKPPPVQVQVSKRVLLNGQVRYEYRVINGSAFPITLLAIGEDYFQGSSELPVFPVGFSESGVPSSSVTSPPGWTFRPIGGEEDSLGELEWEIDSQSHTVAGGSTLAGFSSRMPQACPPCEYGHWTVFLNSAEESFYSWTLEPRAAAPAPLASVFGRNEIHVNPSPMRETVRIEFNAPTGGEVSVRIFDSEGRGVKDLVGEKAEAGKVTAFWDGRDHSGSLTPAGIYFVRIRTPVTERFARFTRVR